MKKGRLAIYAGTVLSLIFLLLLLRKVDGKQLLDALERLDWRYLVAAVLLTFASYWLRAMRWKFLLLHEKRIPVSSLYPAVIIGYMANNLFPARLGEFIRAWVLAERENLSAASVFGSLVIDRLFDGFSVMVILAFVLLTLELPPGMEHAAAILKGGGAATLAAYLVISAFIFFLRLRPLQAVRFIGLLLAPFPVSYSLRIIPLVGSFLEGLKFLPSGRNILMIAVSSFLVWVTATIPIDLVLRGFGIQLPLTASFFIMVLLVFAVMVPAAPGYIGTYHLACYTGLMAFNVSDAEAVSIALVIHAIGFFPVIVAGFIHLWANGISIARIRRQAVCADEVHK